MSYCLNPNCSKPQNPEGIKLCQSCGSPLLLQERYQALKLIGQGGFGRTFLAVDGSKPTKPRCVIKQFFPQQQGTNNSKKAAELFRQEAERLKQLGRHPQIPALLAYFEQDGQQYLVQEFIEGENLAQELAEDGAFNEAKIRELLDSLLPVLKFVHNHQVIHRDIKPANIVRRTTRTQAGAMGLKRKKSQLVLVDFGAAKYATGTALMKTGTTIGSAEYTAPEQMRGKAVFASDLYSLGVTCIHLMTQIRPFDLFDSSEDTWIWRDYLTSSVSESLGQVLDKLLQSATKRRYQAVVEVLRDLMPEATSSEAKPLPHLRTPKLTTPSAKATSASKPIPSWSKTDFVEHYPDSNGLISPFEIPSEGTIESANSAHLPMATPKEARQTAALKMGLVTLMIFTTSSVVRLVANHWQAPDTSSKSEWVKLPEETENLTPEISASAKPLQTLSKSDLVLSVALSPDRETLVSGSAGSEQALSTSTQKSRSSSEKDGQDSKIRVWNLESGKLRYTLDTRYPVWSLAISPDGRTLVTSTTNVSPNTRPLPPDERSDRGSIQIWNLRKGKLMHTLPKSADDGMFIALSPDGQTLASSANEKIKLWNLQTRQIIRTLDAQASGVNSMVFSEDGQTLASTGFDGKISIWNPNTGDLIRTLDGETGSIGAIALTPDGQTLVSGMANGESGSISTWNLETGKLMQTFNPPDAVDKVAISPDGKTIASASSDSRAGMIRIWNLDTGKLMRTIRAHQSVIDSLTFSPDGKSLASGSLDQTIKIWEVSSQ